MLTLEHICRADRLRGQGRFHETPMHYGTTLNRRLGISQQVHLKLELFQRTGSFKVRGASAKIHGLTDAERAQGIIAASAGNHAQGVALAARSLGAQSTIVMPEYAPLTKREATEGYGAKVILHGGSYDEAFDHAVELQARDGGTLVHAFDDPIVMAGQGTIGLEILKQLPDVSAVICPVGGGGLIAGVSTAIKSIRPDVRIIGVQARGANSAVLSFHAKKRLATKGVHTIADGIKVQRVGEHTLEVILRNVDAMVTVDDISICRALLLLDEHSHLSAEPAGATPIAALLNGALTDVLPAAGPIVAIVSGGNMDTFQKTRYVRRALAADHRHLTVRVRMADRRGSSPRQMADLFGLLADHEVNILEIAYRRSKNDLPLGVVEVVMLLETRGADDAELVMTALADSGFELA
jgi:threonine dehydratase